MRELLDFYANNRVGIKRKTVKVKSKIKGTSADKLSHILSQINPSLCGSYLYEHFSWKTDTNGVGLADIIDLNREKLDRFLIRYADKTGGGLGFDSCSRLPADIADVTRRDWAGLQESDGGGEIGEELDSLLHRLDSIDRWMKTVDCGDRGTTAVRHKWDSVDLSLLLLGLHRFGTDFQMLADAIATKTAPMVESFYRMFKDRYGLDKIVPRANTTTIVGDTA